MNLNSTSCTSENYVFRILLCDLRQCCAGGRKSVWNNWILFYDFNKGLSGYRIKWIWEGEGIGLSMV